MIELEPTKLYVRNEDAATTERPRWDGSTTVFFRSPGPVVSAPASNDSLPHAVGIRPRRIDPLSVFVWSVIGLATLAAVVTIRTIVLISAG